VILSGRFHRRWRFWLWQDETGGPARLPLAGGEATGNALFIKSEKLWRMMMEAGPSTPRGRIATRFNGVMGNCLEAKFSF
jgi:hypothetical protein